MKKVIIPLIVVAAIVGSAWIYIVVTTPTRSAGIAFPLGAADRALVARVPASAEAFALIPTAAALDAKLRANPVTRGAMQNWSEKLSLPEPWMIGAADVLAWRGSDGKTRYYVRLDPVRAVVVRAYLMLRDDATDTLTITPPAEQPLPAAEVQQIVDLASKLPAGDAMVVQRVASRGAFPPIARPAVSSVRVDANEIDITSRAPNDGGQSGAPLVARFPRSAVLSASFTSVPRVVGDLNRIMGVNVSDLLSDGGSVSLYDVEFGKLLPRPLGVIAVPADPQRRATLNDVVRFAENGAAFGVNPRTAEQSGELILSFDPSLDLYLKDTFDPQRYPSARWAARTDPSRLVPIVRKLSDSLGFRIAAPRLSHGARDVDRWIDALQQARELDAVDSADAQAEELQVRIRMP